jgi:hypothetical protein
MIQLSFQTLLAHHRASAAIKITRHPRHVVALKLKQSPSMWDLSASASKIMEQLSNGVENSVVSIDVVFFSLV